MQDHISHWWWHRLGHIAAWTALFKMRWTYYIENLWDLPDIVSLQGKVNMPMHYRLTSHGLCYNFWCDKKWYTQSMKQMDMSKKIIFAEGLGLHTSVNIPLQKRYKSRSQVYINHVTYHKSYKSCARSICLMTMWALKQKGQFHDKSPRHVHHDRSDFALIWHKRLPLPTVTSQWILGVKVTRVMRYGSRDFWGRLESVN